MPNTYGRPKNRDEDEQVYAPLAPEDEPSRINEQFAAVAAQDRKGSSTAHDLSHAEQRRIEAETWKANHGFADNTLMSFRMSELEGALVWARRTMFGRVRDETCAKIQAEIQRRRMGGQPVIPALQRTNSFKEKGKKSPRGGRPSNASKNFPLRHSPISTDDQE